MIIVYKNLGETPLQALDRLRQEKPEYAQATLSYAGRLDPMAEGLLLVLVNDECKNKEPYLGLDKEYEVEILWGVETDTHDLLGMVTRASYTAPISEKIETAITTLMGTHMQEYPAYSSKPVQGKSLFAWAREGRIAEIEKPSKKIEVYIAQKIDEREVSNQELKEYIEKTIALVTGDFRQQESIALWQETLKENHVFKITKVRIICSSGTYIRSLVYNLGKELGVGATVFSLRRTAVGSWRI